MSAYGVIAEFDGPDELLDAAAQARDRGYRSFDVHSPFPIHGMDGAMGLRRSRLGWIVFIAGAIGAASGMGMQWFCAAYDYPILTGGKPFFSWQAFIPITFEMMVLFAAFGAVIGMLLLNGLPQWYHPTLKHSPFARASDDGFFLVIEASDPMFHMEQTPAFLTRIGGKEIGLLEE